MSIELSLPLISLIVGVFGAVLGSWMTIKVGMAKFETWREIRDGNIKDLLRDNVLIKEDVYVHDNELAALFEVTKMTRLSRPGMRR